MIEPNYNDGDLKDHHSVAAVIRNEAGEILVMFHHKFNFWTIPVGKVDPGQTITDALKREVMEECNLDIVGYCEAFRTTKLFVRKGLDVKVCIVVFEVDNYTGNLQNNEPNKHSELQFVSIENILKRENRSHSLNAYLEYAGVFN